MNKLHLNEAEHIHMFLSEKEKLGQDAAATDTIILLIIFFKCSFNVKENGEKLIWKLYWGLNHD